MQQKDLGNFINLEIIFDAGESQPTSHHWNACRWQEKSQFVEKSHIAYLNYWGAVYIPIGQLHLMPIDFKIESNTVLEPIAYFCCFCGFTWKHGIKDGNY